MDTMDVVVTLIGVIGTLSAITFAVASYLRGRKKDDAGDGKQDGVVLTEIGYIKSGIDDIKAEQREQRKTNTEVMTRLAAVEASTKQAHKRIDRIDHTPDRD